MAKENGGILLVESNPYVAGQVARAFKESGLPPVVAVAPSVEGAIDTFRFRDFFGFDMVVTRGNLGDKNGIKDGLEVARITRESDSGIPTVLYTDISHNHEPQVHRLFSRVVHVGSAGDVPRLVTAVRGLSRPSRR